MLTQHDTHPHARFAHDAPSHQEHEPVAKLPSGGMNLKHHVAQIEQNLIRQALEQSQGVVACAARLLRLRRTTLVEKIRKYRNGSLRFQHRHFAA